MRTEDRIWALVARRLADEATIEELQELDELLKNIPGPTGRLKSFPTGGRRTSGRRSSAEEH